MKVSREVDLTRNLVFQKEEPILKKIDISPNGSYDYKRYNEYEDKDGTYSFTSTSSTESIFSFTDPFSGTFTSINMTSITPLLPKTKKVEERVCWRKLFKDPNIYVISRTPEEWEDYLKQMNFPLGSKEDRLQVKYDKLEDKIKNSECERCGRKIRRGYNCLKTFDSLCTRCSESFYKERIKKVCWR